VEELRLVGHEARLAVGGGIGHCAGSFPLAGLRPSSGAACRYTAGRLPCDHHSHNQPRSQTLFTTTRHRAGFSGSVCTCLAQIHVEVVCVNRSSLAWHLIRPLSSCYQGDAGKRRVAGGRVLYAPKRGVHGLPFIPGLQAMTCPRNGTVDAVPERMYVFGQHRHAHCASDLCH
jgi:hypothetical protein